ncbi:hypothetical protein [Microbacterium enclense]|uniref:hypothetical protein n=1 Tax=Microbacterium enclense TaxID=993073 RepID=UPI00341E900A
MGKVSLNTSGVVMTAGFAIVVVAGVAVLPDGGVASLAAALAIAVGFAGGGYGILRMARSSGAAERVQTTAAADRARAQREAQRALRVQSIVSLVSGVLIGVTLPLLEDPREGTVIRFGFLSAVLVLLGIGGLIAGARSEGARPDVEALPASSPRGAPDQDSAVQGWQLITRRDLRSVLTVVAPGAGLLVFVALQSSSFFFFATRTMSRGVAIAALLVVLVLIVIVVIVVVRAVPQVWINVATRRVRFGSKTVAWHEVTGARLSGSALFVGGRRSLVLTLEGPDKVRIPLILRRRGELAMTTPQRRAALAMIEGASIAVPRAPEDPTGKFSKTYYPSHLDAAQARSLVARPPRSDEELPVAIG